MTTALLRDLRYAWRTLVRTPGWTTMAVVTLALGTGANTAVFAFVDALLFRPAPGVAEPARIVSIFTSDYSSGPYGETSYPDFLSIARGVEAFERTAAEDDSLVAPLRVGDTIERVRIAKVTAHYFDVLRLKPASGRGVTGEDARGAASVAVISHAFWLRGLGGRDAIGTAVRVNSSTFTIVGVAPAGFRGLDLGRPTDVWLPLTETEASHAGRGDRMLLVVARLRQDATIARAQQQVAALASQLAREYPASNLGTLDRPRDPRPMTVAPATRIAAPFRAEVISLAAVLMGGVALVLLLACANVASLVLARATTRAREIAVRRAIGATSWQVVRQLLTETAVLALLSAGVGLLIAAWTSDILPSFFPAEQAALLETAPGWHMLLFALVTACATSLLVGLLPALRAIRTPLAPSLRAHGQETADGGGSRMRNALVAAQVGIACVLLVGAALLVQSVANTLRADLGMATKEAALCSVELPGQWSAAAGLAYYDDARARVAALPGVDGVAWVRTLPLAPSGRRGFRAEGYTPAPNEDRELNVNYVSPEYFVTAGIPLRAGRGFAAIDATGPPVVVVNETLARRFFRGDAVGRKLTDSSDVVSEIVGVVGDTKYLTVGEAPPPFVYYPLSRAYTPRMTLIARTRVPASQLGEAVRRVLRGVDGDVAVFATRTLRGHVAEALGAERLTATLVAVCGGLALVLAVVGLYGAIAYLVSRRSREIGVRIALGATPRRVLGLVIGQGLWMTGAGTATGVLAAILLARIAPLTLYGVTPLDPRTYIVVALALMLTSAFAAFLPALRATRLDPSRVLSRD